MQRLSTTRTKSAGRTQGSDAPLRKEYADPAQQHIGALQMTAGNRVVNRLLAGSPRSTDEQLDDGAREELERSFGRHFEDVRLHTDEATQQAVMASDAKAITIGRDVFFGPGQYQPHTAAGHRVLVHEFAHLAEQAEGMEGGALASATASEQAAAIAERSDASSGLASVGAAPFGVAQADPAGESELHFFGKAGESGVGVLYIRGWANLTPAQQGQVQFWLSEADQAYGAGVAGPRQSVSAAQRAAANQVARAGRRGLASTTGSASGHTPDVAGGGDPMSPQIDLPSRVNSSIGGQWKRYEAGFRFTGISAYDEATGQWIYLSGALEHEPPPTLPGPPVRGAVTPQVSTPAATVVQTDPASQAEIDAPKAAETTGSAPISTAPGAEVAASPKPDVATGTQSALSSPDKAAVDPTPHIASGTETTPSPPATSTVQETPGPEGIGAQSDAATPKSNVQKTIGRAPGGKGPANPPEPAKTPVQKTIGRAPAGTSSGNPPEPAKTPVQKTIGRAPAGSPHKSSTSTESAMPKPGSPELLSPTSPAPIDAEPLASSGGSVRVRVGQTSAVQASPSSVGTSSAGAAEKPAVSTAAGVETPVAKVGVPPTSQAKVAAESATSAGTEGATFEEGVAGARAARGVSGIRFVGGVLAEFAIWMMIDYILSRWYAEREESEIAELMAANVEPRIKEQLAEQDAECQRLRLGNPYSTVYANVTVQLQYRGIADKYEDKKEGVDGLSFTDLQVSLDPLERVIEGPEVTTSRSIFTADRHYKVTRTLTFPLPLQFTESDESLEQRRAAFTAQKLVDAGIPVQVYAEAATIISESQTVRLVEAYINVATGSQREQAVKYLEEVRRRPPGWRSRQPRPDWFLPSSGPTIGR
jgi:hypothetical protein